MKKQLIIIGGVGVIVVLLLVWVYLLFFGTPKSGDQVMDNLGINDDTKPELVDNSTTSTEQAILNTDRKKLRQLTTKPIAGFNEIISDDIVNLPTVYYVEMGTGHVYSLNLASGEEKRISATTISGANVASVSSKGKYVAIGNRNNKTFPLMIGEISTSSEGMTPLELSRPVDQFQISFNGDELLYTTKENFGLVAHSYNLESGSDKAIFNLPFHEATVQWGNKSTDTHYLYPKPAYLLEGYLYKVQNGKMARLPVDGFGLTALANEDMAFYSTAKNASHKNYIYDFKNNKKTETPFTFLPEKCIVTTTGSKIICAWEGRDNLPMNFPDAWYKGEMSFKDSLWMVFGYDQSSELLVDTFKDSGRDVDITDLTIGNSERALYFINNNDNTLWMYEF